MARRTVLGILFTGVLVVGSLVSAQPVGQPEGPHATRSVVESSARIVSTDQAAGTIVLTGGGRAEQVVYVSADTVFMKFAPAGPDALKPGAFVIIEGVTLRFRAETVRLVDMPQPFGGPQGDAAGQRLTARPRVVTMVGPGMGLMGQVVRNDPILTVGVRTAVADAPLQEVEVELPEGASVVQQVPATWDDLVPGATVHASVDVTDREHAVLEGLTIDPTPKQASPGGPF